MFKIADGREHFYQWDLDRQIIVEDPTITEVHFCNRTDECSLVTEVVDGHANVPNILLQSSYDIRVFGYDGKATLYEKKFKVSARTRPADYVYTETELVTVQTMIDRANHTLEQTNEALTNTEEALANANEAVNTANEAVEAAEKAYDRANEAVSEAEKFAEDAKEAADRAEAAADYYTKEETLEVIEETKPVVYLDFRSYSTSSTPALEEHAKVFDRLRNGENLALYIMADSGSPYGVADIKRDSDSVIVLILHYTTNIDSIHTTVVNYILRAKADGWTVTEYRKFTDKFATEQYVDEKAAGFITEEELEAKGYLTEHQSLEGYATEQYVEEHIPTKMSDLENDSDYITATKADSKHNSLKEGVSDFALALLGLTVQVAGWDRFPIDRVNSLNIAYTGLVNNPFIQWVGSDSTYFSSKEFGNTITKWWVVDAAGNQTTGNQYLYTNHIYIWAGAQMFDIESEDAFKKLIANALVYDNSTSGLTATTITGAINELAARPSGGGSGGNVDLTGYATEDWVKSQGYLTEHQSLEGLATKDYVDSLFEGIATAEGGAY